MAHADLHVEEVIALVADYVTAWCSNAEPGDC